MPNVIGLTGALVVYSTLLCLTNIINWEKSDFCFIIKKAIDCVVYPSTYIVLVIIDYISIQSRTPYESKGYYIIICLLLSATSLYLYTKQLIIFSNSTSRLNRKVFPMVLVSLLVGIISSLSTVNYAIYMIWPSFYEIPAELSFGEVAFEFIYYMFTLAITYSGSSIQATHIITKIIQILEICYCYVIFGNVIVQFIGLTKSEE